MDYIKGLARVLMQDPWPLGLRGILTIVTVAAVADVIKTHHTGQESSEGVEADRGMM